MCGALAKSVVIVEKLPVLPPGYSVCGAQLAYNEIDDFWLMAPYTYVPSSFEQEIGFFP